MKVLEFKPVVSSNLVEELEKLVEKAKTGEIDNLVCAYTDVDNYGFIYHSSIEKALVLASLLHDKCVNRFKL